ncbi:DUF397 domain-containing protein [Streptomyces coeruleorubidus]|uniref:DUF397 domain-containing protein n=1 Tax=Streptomyces coeruleorubidus TaxID=116188 RepID=A0ABZ0KGJ1_STRC4|nr:DUF397 domain-containing protein [Streptomyces coeruleorubidus]WOT37010.1 DUF397 domain-containing protein [Streptomyces coeruleorubidus]
MLACLRAGRGCPDRCRPQPGWRKALASSWAWRKSSRSGGPGQNCVEVASTGTTVFVRHSRRPDHAVLAVSPTAWTALCDALADGLPFRPHPADSRRAPAG